MIHHSRHLGIAAQLDLHREIYFEFHLRFLSVNRERSETEQIDKPRYRLDLLPTKNQGC